MQNVQIKPFKIIGISIRTTNENGEASLKIPELWNRFMQENLIHLIPNKIDNTIYSLYTEYEADHTKPYTTIIGCKVNSLEIVPKGMVGKSFEGGNYYKTTAKGDLTNGLIINHWSKIWAMDIERKFTADFEVYGKNAQNPKNAEVDILVAIK
ncbi:GyrI-like domain-containing protein [Aquimarina pacifica]|uniref:GyrI-like domain-containing protein n=1 Tax=Aquimarina pacifica TaxID=1296415 RepID=UPI00046F4AAF|nr:GyrI-like domain-containing protein [Aquimarina pacifica]